MAQLDPEQQAIARTIGSRVKALREDRGLSQERLARAADTSFVTINRIESSARLEPKSIPAIDTLQKIAWALDVEITDLFRSSNDQANGSTSDEATNSYLRYMVDYQGFSETQARVICRNRTRRAHRPANGGSTEGVLLAVGDAG